MSIAPSQQRKELIEDLHRTFELLSVEARHQITERLKPFKLSIPQYLALYALAGKEEAISLSELGAEIDAVPSSMTSIIDRLVQEELVSREPHPDDRRSITTTITAQGREVIAQLHDLRLADLAFMIDGLSDEEVRRLTETLRHLRRQTETLLHQMRQEQM